MKLRSPRELGFRARQYAAGWMDYVLPPPRTAESLLPLPLPDAAGLAKSLLETPHGVAYCADLCRISEQILLHRFPIFGGTIETGPEIDWRRDYRHGISTPPIWYRKIPFLDFQKSGDHKFIWELNRHQHLVVLSQAWIISGDPRFTREIAEQIRSWHAQNPFLRSVNWASALEIAFRALSWLWVLHLAGPALDADVRKRLGTLLLQHGVAIVNNLSTYFAPNTHILGEAVALHALGLVLGKPRWTAQGARIVGREMQRQVQADGMHFEQSSYYHVYALDMLVFHYLLAGRPPAMEAVIRRMAGVCGLLVDGSGEFPLIGDDDGGRFFHPYGPRGRFAQATLATCAALFPDLELPARPEDLAEQAYWWLGPVAVNKAAARDASAHLEPSGLTIFRKRGVHVTFDCGPFSSGGAGHSHADTLAITLRVNGREVLIDPGTFTYVADPVERDWFRGTGAHCTLKLGGRDQADAVHPFRWENKPAVRRTLGEGWRAAGECRYRGWTHARAVDFQSEDVIRIEDWVTGPADRGGIEQIWHAAAPIEHVSGQRFRIGESVIEVDPRLRVEVQAGFRSGVLGSKEPSFLLCCTGDTPVDGPLRTVIDLFGEGHAGGGE